VDKKVIKGMMLEMLKNHMDEYLFSEGFTRSCSSLAYKRNHDESIQKMDFSFGTPRYSDDRSLAHIKPTSSIKMNKIEDNLALLHLPEDLKFGLDEHTVKQPFGILGPTRSLVDWRPNEEKDFCGAVGQSLHNYVREWVTPFMREYSRIEQIIKNFEKEDYRQPKVDIWFIRVAIAYKLSGELSRALEVLENRFTSPASQKRYGNVINAFR